MFLFITGCCAISIPQSLACAARFARSARRWSCSAKTSCVAGAVSPGPSSSPGRPSDLILAALVRARFGELLQDRIEHGGSDLFLLGLLSLMDAILQVPMSVVLDGLQLDSDSTAMLLDNDGPLLPFYRLLWTIERGVWGAVVRACDQLGLSEEYVAECFSNAMGWAQSVTSGF